MLVSKYDAKKKLDRNLLVTMTLSFLFTAFSAGSCILPFLFVNSHSAFRCISFMNRWLQPITELLVLCIEKHKKLVEHNYVRDKQ